MSPRKPIPTHLTEAVLQEHPPKKPRRKRSFGSRAFRPTIRIYPDRRKEALLWADKMAEAEAEIVPRRRETEPGSEPESVSEVESASELMQHADSDVASTPNTSSPDPSPNPSNPNPNPPKKPKRKRSRSFGSQAFRPTIRIYPDRRKEALVWAQETGAESDTGSGSELAQLHDVDGDGDGDVERSADFASASPEPESGLEPGQVVADPARSSSSSSSTSPHLYFEESRSKPVRRFSCPNMMSTDVSPTDYPFT